MKYVVVVPFNDLQDGEKRYEVGDEYPRNGLKPTQKRIKELATESNRRGLVLIEKVKVDDPAKD